MNVYISATIEMEMPFPAQGITLAALRRLHAEQKEALKKSFPEIEFQTILFSIPCDLEQRVAVSDLPGFMPASKLPGSRRSDFGSCERFNFKWKREND